MSNPIEDSSRRLSMVAGLGCCQLIAWGTLYYAIAVIGEPIRTELGLAGTQLFGSFTVSMALSGVLAPWVGRKLDQHGGRTVLAASTVVGALGFVALSCAHSFVMLVLAWSINGLAMSLGLYEACFAALGQADPRGYRRAVTGVSLIAGFASTFSWPVSHYLLASIGWRATCQAFAACLLMCAPIYLLVLPSVRVVRARAPTEQNALAALADASTRKRARVLSMAFAGASLLGAAMSAHLVVTLREFHFTPEQAVWIGSSIGVMQVFGRTLEFLGWPRHRATTLGVFAFSGLAVAMLLLLIASMVPRLVFVFVVIYGVANGLLTIAKAVLPIRMFGIENVGSVLGRFSAPSLVMRAIAPLGFAAVVSALGSRAAVGCSALVGLASVWAYVAATGRSAAIRDAGLARAKH